MKFALSSALCLSLAGCVTPAPTPQLSSGWQLPSPAALRSFKPEAIAVDAPYPVRQQQLARDLLSLEGQPLLDSVLCPASLMQCMELVSSGARGKTAAELASALHTSPAQILPDGIQYLSLSNQVGKSVEIVQAQRIYLRGRLNPAMDKACEAFHTDVLPLPGLPQIDVWIKQATHGKITRCGISPGELEVAQLLCLQTLYLKAEWQTPFEPARSAPFTSGSQKRDVPTMVREGLLRYAEDDALRVLELPYAGDRLVFDCLLPKAADGLEEVQAKLTRRQLDSLFKALRSTRVEVALPRFHVSRTHDFIPYLKALGVQLAFRPGKADFSGLAPGTFISVLRQQVVLDVTERGTEATAATVVLHASGTPPERVVFRADHPFLFLIRDRQSGIVFFCGRVVFPESGQP